MLALPSLSDQLGELTQRGRERESKQMATVIATKGILKSGMNTYY